MRFYYQVRTEDGRRHAGQLEARSRLEALRQLAARGWHVDYCDTRPPHERSDRASRPENGPRLFATFIFLRPWPGHLASFYHQLGQLLGAGVSPYEAAMRLAEHAPSRHLRLIMAQVAPALARGESLADNLARYPQFFPAEVVGLLRAAERSGDWEGICRDLQDWYTRAYRGLLWFVVARVYYVAVFALVLLVPYFPYIISRGVQWYLHFALTRILPIIGVLIVAWLALRASATLPASKPLRDHLAATFPLIASLTRRLAAARFLRALSSLVRAGVEPAEALELAAAATGNAVFEAQGRRAADAVRSGADVEAVAGNLPFLDTQQRNVLATAFVAGRLDEGLSQLAAQSADAAAAQAVSLRIGLQGLIFVIAAVAVGVAVVVGYLNYLRSMAEAAGATDLLEELLK